ncbi:MAG: sigma factor-like helix-turn-helix DNA-binding protein [Patescibacteria group bacterium]
MATLTIKPKLVVKALLKSLPDRAQEVIIKRYGLGKNSEKMTLEAIGKTYGITRERVRQIENYAIANIQKSKEYEMQASAFKELEVMMSDMGSIIAEEDLLDSVSRDLSVQNHIYFLLVLGRTFKWQKEDEHFKHRWHVDETTSKKVEEALKKLYKNLKDDDIIPESEMIDTFLNHIEDLNDRYRNDEILKRWLSISKKVAKNPLGEWGVSHSPNIKAKGMRDYAFLVIRKHGSPIHFREVAKQIEKLFNRKAHIATTHNELIKDPRFVLVGRGLYALSEWGYMSGVVKDVIKKILEKHGPLGKKEIIDKVLKERYVKENTILVNLQNPKYFKKDKDGKYSVVA